MSCRLFASSQTATRSLAASTGDRGASIFTSGTVCVGAELPSSGVVLGVPVFEQAVKSIINATTRETVSLLIFGRVPSDRFAIGYRPSRLHPPGIWLGLWRFG